MQLSKYLRTTGLVRSFTEMQAAKCASAAPSFRHPNERQSYILFQKKKVSKDSFVLRFNIPDGRDILGVDPQLPTCISVIYKDGTDEKTKESVVLKKSYSPISHPSEIGFFDLLVKKYPIRPGGGVGSYLCRLNEGDSIEASLKAERIMHGSPRVLQRWNHVGLVAGGTGIAPLYQIIQILLNSGENTTVHLLSINRFEDDILMKQELDAMAQEHPTRLHLTYSLTGKKYPSYYHGSGSVELALKSLPPPKNGDGSTMILICGKKGFVETWGGKIGRGPPLENGKKGPKIQGPLFGILKDAGYHESEVFKY